METIEFDVVKIKKKIISGLKILKKWLIYAISVVVACFLIYYLVTWLLREKPKLKMDSSTLIETVQAFESALGHDNPVAFLKTSSNVVNDLKDIIEKKPYASEDKLVIANYRNRDTRIAETIDKSRQKISSQMQGEQAWEKRNYKKAYTSLENSVEEPDTVLWATMNAGNFYNPFNPIDRILPFSRLKNYLRLAGISQKMSQSNDAQKWLSKADDMVNSWYDNPDTADSLVHPCYAQAFIMFMKNQKAQAQEIMGSVPEEQTDLDIEIFLKKISGSESPQTTAASFLYEK